jgi:hypothetical protein
MEKKMESYHFADHFETIQNNLTQNFLYNSIFVHRASATEKNAVFVIPPTRFM